MRVFGEQRGGVITAYFCQNIRVAAALTDIWSAADRADGRILSLEEVKKEEADEERRFAELNWLQRRWEALRGRVPRPGGLNEKASNTAIHLEPIFGDPDSPRAKQILFRCLKVHYHALEYLKPKPRKICMRMTFNVITTLLGTLDSRAGRGEPASAFESSYEDQRALNEELLSTEAYYRGSARAHGPAPIPRRDAHRRAIRGRRGDLDPRRETGCRGTWRSASRPAPWARS